MVTAVWPDACAALVLTLASGFLLWRCFARRGRREQRAPGKGRDPTA